MKGDVFVASADKMVDDVGSGGISATGTKPFVANEALNDAFDVVYATVSVPEQNFVRMGT